VLEITLRSLSELVVLNVPGGRHFLWSKTIQAMRHVYERHIDEFDWFMRADDDK
jgi:glycoprotein-N-acetylgalactosamine 3-beta-galactosyltransferase